MARTGWLRHDEHDEHDLDSDDDDDAMYPPTIILKDSVQKQRNSHWSSRGSVTNDGYPDPLKLR